MKRMRIFLIMALYVLALYGCRENIMDEISKHENKTTVNLAVKGMASDVNSQLEDVIDNVFAFRFLDGVLVQEFEHINLASNRSFDLHFTEKRGKLVLWANADGFLADSTFMQQITTEEEFMAYTATAEQMSRNRLTMTASVDLDTVGSELYVQLKRSLARIDLKSEFEGVKVRKVALHGISDKGYVNDVPAIISPTTTSWVKELEDETGDENVQTLFYPCAQPKATYNVELDVLVDGAWRKLTTTLGAINRNTLYTIRVYGNGSTIGVTVLEDDWQNGHGVTSGQLIKGLIDVDTSVLSENVRVSDTQDTLFLPYIGADVQLVLKANPGAEVVMRGTIDGVEVLRNAARSLVTVANFEVHASHRFPGRTTEYLYLDVMEGTTKKGRVVVVAEANPIGLVGHVKLDENGVCDFNRYIDGELGVITLPEGKTVSMRFPEGEKEWARLVAVDGQNNVFRIEGGWKPNDPEADGRLQQVELVIEDATHTTPEVYTLIRKNWGLPVVNINGTWWCRYNLRGNVKNFEDQITLGNNPVGEEGITEYLKTCSDEDFVAMAGDQYQAGNQEGLKLKLVGESFVYEGFDSNNQMDFGSVDPEYMAPDGYQVPDYSNYRFFTWAENVNLGYGSNVFNNQLGQRINYSITERDIAIEGVSYGTMHVYDYVYDGQHWVLLGMGHQYNATEISGMSIIFATYGKAGKSWMMEGYRQSDDGRGNWYKYASQNAQKTRMIRCVKKPVEYIYE